MPPRVELITDLDRFLDLEPSWNELVVASGGGLPFLRHEWLRCWIRSFGAGASLVVATVWSDGALVAAAPLQVRRRRLGGIPARELTFLSSGISPRCQLLVEPSHRAETLLEAAFSRRGYDVVQLRNLERDLDITRETLGFLAARGSSPRVEPGRSSPCLRTAGPWDGFSSSLSKSLRQNIRTAFNRLDRAGSYEIAKLASFAEIEPVFEELVATSARSWKARSGRDLGSNEALGRFYRDFSREGSEGGLYEVWTLRLQGAVAAFDYHLRGPRSLSLIRNDFDEAFGYYSPGSVLRAAVLRDLFGRGDGWEYDFGGQPYGYKLAWTPTAREHVHVTASAGTLVGRLLHLGRRARRRGRIAEGPGERDGAASPAATPSPDS